MAAHQARPDNANADKPRDVHWKTAIGISGYAFSTSDVDITFRGLELVVIADEDQGRPLTRGQFSGGAVMCMGACVCWFR